MAPAASSEAAILVESKFPSETHQFTWSIAEFEQLNDSKEMIRATETTFEMGRSIGCPVTLKAYLTLEEDRYSQNGIGVFFKALDEEDNEDDDDAPRKVMARAHVKIGDYKEVQLSPKNLMGRGWGWSRLIETADLARLPLDEQGSLPIDVAVTLYSIPGIGLSIANLMPKYKSRFLQKFSADMEKMYKEPDHFAPGAPTMITVVSKDLKKLPSNSMMLAARSSVFQTMFQTPMKETKEGVVNIDDIGGDALEVFLHFMHTGILLENWKEPEILEDLTRAAHRYLMQDLVDFLDVAIGLVCTPDNCTRMLRVAQRLEMKNAEKTLLKMLQDQCKQATSLGEMVELVQE